MPAPTRVRCGAVWWWQSLVSDIIVELHAAGFADMDLNASVRATSCVFMLDLQQARPPPVISP